MWWLRPKCPFFLHVPQIHVPHERHIIEVATSLLVVLQVPQMKPLANGARWMPGAHLAGALPQKMSLISTFVGVAGGVVLCVFLSVSVETFGVVWGVVGVTS